MGDQAIRIWIEPRKASDSVEDEKRQSASDQSGPAQAPDVTRPNRSRRLRSISSQRPHVVIDIPIDESVLRDRKISKIRIRFALDSIEYEPDDWALEKGVEIPLVSDVGDE